MKKFLLCLNFISAFIVCVPMVYAEGLALSKTPTQIHAVITDIESTIPIRAGMNTYTFHAKTDVGDSYDVNTSDSNPGGIPIKLVAGEKIFLQKIDGTPPQIYFDDVERTNALWWIVILFVILSLAVGLRRGFWSLIGLGITLVVLFGYIFPGILHGQDVITVTVIGSIAILAVNMHIAHGFRKESFLAFVSTVIGFLFVWLFAHLFSAWTSLTGTGSEDAVLLMGDIPVQILSIRLFVAGAILGAVGVLDDIAISQTEIVHELVITDPNLTHKQLFLKSMRIGRHHIASTINTLVLVYAGASMPVLILFLYHSGDVNSFLNSEIVTEEIVRTIAGTAALILTVPISSLIATYGYNKKSLDTPHRHT